MNVVINHWDNRQPVAVVTATNGLLESARLYRVGDGAAECAAIGAIADFLGAQLARPTEVGWPALREQAEASHETPCVKDFYVQSASLPLSQGACDVVLFAFILIEGATITEVELFDSQAEAEAHGLAICQSRFDGRALRCRSFDEVKELDADNDSSVYVIRLRATGEPDFRPAVPMNKPRFPLRATVVVTVTGGNVGNIYTRGRVQVSVLDLDQVRVGEEAQIAPHLLEMFPGLRVELEEYEITV